MTLPPPANSPLGELALEQFFAGGFNEFRDMFAAGVRYRLRRVQAPGSDNKQCEAILREASELTNAARERNEKLTLQGISGIVNSCIKRSLPSTVTTAAVIPIFAGADKVASELSQLSSQERNAMTHFFLDEISEEAACAASGLSVEAFQAVRKKFRLIMSEAGRNPSDGGLASLSRAVGPSVGCASAPAPTPGAIDATKTGLIPTRDVLKGAA